MSDSNIKVVCLDDCPNLRMLMGHLIKCHLDVDCLCLASVAEFIDQGRQVLQSQMVILDVNLGVDQPDGVEAHQWLVDNDYQGKVIFLTGHARQHPQVAEAALDGVEVFEKPLPTDILMNVISKAVCYGETAF